MINSVHEDFTRHYKVHCADHTRLYDGIEDMLRNLKKAGVKLAVVSNKADYAVKELCEDFFCDMFDAVVGERDGVRKKPAPDSVNEVMRMLGFTSEKCVYIGDSDVDILTAKNAKMSCISVDWGFRDRAFLIESGARYIVSSPKEIEKCII